ncbi:N-acetyltransferase [Pseudomonas sp. v388]|uniref:GNAT family N-acetyltransferase n=1 Tax=Pseudomonas sp. v388 TaxID=2479849 RepID=UPI000F786E57|nr:GNAT family N-acetyltransferase [Pseudomonas sp. v388]RRV06880.1 N-acetyltransferase [Pseudomonas sp. v388]
MNLQPLALPTPRLVIRHFQTADVPALAAVLGDAQVMRFSVRGVMDERAVGEFVHNCMACYHADGFGPMAVVELESAQLIGFCGLNAEMVDGAREVEIGYRLSPRFWGRGLATEAVEASLRHGFETLGLGSIIAIVQPQNVASVRVLHKVGFHDYIHSQYHRLGVRIYRLTGSQWAARHC